MLDSRIQPALESVLVRLGEEISARAVLLLQEDGQVLHSAGTMAESEMPVMAALIAAMIATGKSLGNLGDAFPDRPNRFSCDSEWSGMYLVAVEPGIWLSTLYDQPLNPGKLRLRVRQTAALCAQLGVRQAVSGVSGVSAVSAVRAKAEIPSDSPVTSFDTNPGAKTTPPVATYTPTPEKITENNSSLFTNITDDEIDRLFANPSS